MKKIFALLLVAMMVLSLFACSPKEGAEILVQRGQEVQMAVNGYGRSVYISGLPYSFDNSCVLYRTILWAADGQFDLHLEANQIRWYEI